MVQDTLIPLAVHCSKRQRKSWVGDKFVFKYKAYFTATVRVAADMHLIGGAEVAMSRKVWLVYSAVTRRNQPIAKVANGFVQISQIVEANRLRRFSNIYARREWILLCRDSRYATDVFVNYKHRSNYVQIFIFYFPGQTTNSRVSSLIWNYNIYPSNRP